MDKHLLPHIQYAMVKGELHSIILSYEDYVIVGVTYADDLPLVMPLDAVGNGLARVNVGEVTSWHSCEDASQLMELRAIDEEMLRNAL